MQLCRDCHTALYANRTFAETPVERAGHEASSAARFHFRPHFHQHAGFRLARSARPPCLTHVDSPPPHAAGWDPRSRAARGTQDSESSSTAHAARMLAHYCADDCSDVAGALRRVELPPPTAFMAQACAQLTRVMARQGHTNLAGQSVMEIGCGVGGLAHRLARRFGSVLAVDCHAERIAAAKAMQAQGHAAVECDARRF